MINDTIDILDPRIINIKINFVAVVDYSQDKLEALNVAILELPGWEADDIIGTCAKQAEQQGYITYMVTPDKDYAQLVSENI